MQRIQEAQRKRTPQEMEAAIQRAEESRRLTAAERKCKTARSHAVRSSALAFEGLRQMATSASPAEYSAVQTRWAAAQEASDSRQMARFHEIEARSALTAPAAIPEAVAVVRDEDEENEEAADFQAVAQLMGAQDTRVMVAAADVEGGGAQASELEALLLQLKVEPTEDVELAAKFSLYTGYSEEVGKMRKTLLEFWEESKPSIPPAVAQGMERTVKSIDTADNMGIQDGLREWFVYHMMKQAAKNNKSMAKILEEFQQRLHFLATNTQDECPICLENFSQSGARAAETLSCCHKVCKECWENWCTVTHGHPFCPLCKHAEFLGAVASGMGM